MRLRLEFFAALVVASSSAMPAALSQAAPAAQSVQTAPPATTAPHAQEAPGTLVTGVVINGSDAKPVPSVLVHLVNKNLKPITDRVTKTDEDGNYNFENVPAALGYSVDVYDATGKLVGTDPSFNVTPDDALHAAVPQIDISRGITAARAKISGGLAENDRGFSPGSNISNEQLRVLPLFNRNFLNLGLIQPGVHDVEQGSPLQGAAFSIAGQRSTSTYFLLDGVDNVASSTNQAIPFQVNEAVREFRVTYANPSMRYGQGSGGIVDVITSSGDTGAGGKAYHGSVFGYFNSDKFNGSSPLSVYSNSGFARAASYANGANAFSDVIYINSAGGNPSSTGTPGPNCLTGGDVYCGYSPQSYNALYTLLSNTAYGLVSSCNTPLCAAGAFNPTSVLATQDSRTQPITSKQFGGSIGGPLGKNTYLFGSYESTLIDNPTPIFERVPTTFDKTPIGTANAADANISRNLLALYPNANVGQTGGVTGATGTGVFGFYRGLAPNYTHVHTVQVRPDISLKGLGSLSLRYTGQLLDQLHDDTLPAGGAYPGNGANRKAQNQSAAITYNLPFGQNRNLLSIAFTQYRVDEVAQDRGFNTAGTGLPAGPMPSMIISGIDPQNSAVALGSKAVMGGWYDSFWETCTAAQSGLSACGASSRSPSAITPSLDGNFPLARLGAPLSAPNKHRDTEAFLSDVFDIHLSNRNYLTVGGDYRYQQNFSYEGGMARGLVVANNIGQFTHDSETCVSCSPQSAFVHPSFDYELRQPTGYTGDLRSSTFGVFAEHKFQPMDRLTLTMGVRYEYFGQPLDTGNRLWNYNFSNIGLSRQGATGTYDAFAYQCGGGTSFFDAVYGALRASTPASGRLCNVNGSFNLPTDKNNVAGLLGFAFSPESSYHHVIRGAVGIYYDHAPASYTQKLLLNRPSPYNVANPSSIYGSNFASSYSSANCQQGTQCAFGLSTLNFASFGAGSTAQSTFQNYQAASGANVLYSRDPNALNTPYSVQFSTSYQQRFSGSWTGELGYVGSFTNNVPLVYDGNFSLEFYCQTNGVCSNDTYFPVFTQSNIGSANYHSAVARVEGRLWHGLSLHASYTMAKSLDNVAGSDFPNTTDSLFTQLYGRQLYALGNPAVFALQQSTSGYGSNNGLRGGQLSNQAARTAVLQSANIPSFDSIQSALTTTGSRVVNVSRYTLPQNPLAFSSAGAAQGEDYGRSDFDVRHRGVADFVYNMPSFGHKWLGGFTVSGITTVQSGQPYTIFSGPAYGQVTQRVNLASPSAVSMTGSRDAFVNAAGQTNITGVGRANLPSNNSTACPTLYAVPNLYRASSQQGACTGNSGRNIFTGPAYFAQDLAAQKATHLVRGHEGHTLILRAEFYNLFNRANFYNPISEISTDGVHINPEFGLVRSAHDARQIQFAARYEF